MRFFRKKKPVPDGVFVKCKGCGEMVYRKNVEELVQVCPECNYHFRLGAMDRVRIHADEGSFEEHDADLVTADPLNFTAAKVYLEQIASDVEKTGLNEAIVYGTCTIQGRPAVLAAMDFKFRGAAWVAWWGKRLPERQSWPEIRASRW